MKLLVNSLLLFFFVVSNVLGQGLKVSYGLPQGTCYKETGNQSKFEFVKNDIYDARYVEYKKNLRKIMPEFENDKTYVPKNKANLFLYADNHVPYFSGLMKLLAPTLAFRFFGPKSIEYVLDLIKIKYLDVQASNVKAVNDFTWYDVVLNPDMSDLSKSQTLKPKNQLIFSGNGTSELRFWGEAGRYLIEMTFCFSYDGTRKCEVTTEPFYLNIYN